MICSLPDFIENSIFLSAVQTMAAAAQLRAIHHAAYPEVQLFRSLEALPGDTPGSAEDS